MDALSTFGLRLFASSAKTTQNVFLSPFSLFEALAMVSHGSAGETRTELETVLGVSDIDALGKQLQEYNTKLANQSAVTLQVANSTWVQQTHRLLQSFSQTVQTNYRADAFPLNVGDENLVNDWCEKKTNGLVKGVLSPGTITNDSAMLLINAIHFKGTWQTQFPKERTVEETFHARTKDLVVPLMHLPKTRLFYKETDSYKAVRLNYGDSSYAAVIVLPNDISTLDTLTQNLSTDIFFNDYNSKEGLVALPRFQIEWGTESVLKSLRELGLNKACGHGTADFSQLCDPADVAITDVFHKAVLKVNEEGTEAAAATVVMMTRCLAIIHPFEFKVDRPFLFSIVDLSANAILFLGKIEEPATLE